MISFMEFKNGILIISSKNEVVYAAFSKSLNPERGKLMNTFLVSAGLKTCAGKTSTQALTKLAKLQAQTIKEPGCIRFDILQHRDNSELFTLWEEWLSEQDLQAHFKAAHTLEYLAMELTEVVYIEKLVRIKNA